MRFRDENGHYLIDGTPVSDGDRNGYVVELDTSEAIPRIGVCFYDAPNDIDWFDAPIAIIRPNVAIANDIHAVEA